MQLAVDRPQVRERARQVGALVGPRAPALDGGEHVELARPRLGPVGVGDAQDAVGADRVVGRHGARAPAERGEHPGHDAAGHIGTDAVVRGHAATSGRCSSCSESTSGSPARAARIARTAASAPESVVMHGIPRATAALRIS